MTMLATLACVAVPVAGNACSVLTPQGEARLGAKKAQFLHRYSDTIVFGTWSENQADEMFVDGFVSVTEAESDNRYAVQFAIRIDCSPSPSNGQLGTFYLRADIDEIEDFAPDSPTLLGDHVN
ncbi:MAG: hypothetical protein WCY11_21380 [Novosphingobium sp.]